MKESNLLGHWGEATAAAYLRRRGYEILACNFRSRFGEIDLIAQKKNYVVFCEVKTRKDVRRLPRRWNLWTGASSGVCGIQRPSGLRKTTGRGSPALM